MGAAKRRDRSRKRPRIQPEPLENRALLTGGAGNTFALMASEFPAESPGAAEVRFSIDLNDFQTPSNRMVLGVDVTPRQDSESLPRVSGIRRDLPVSSTGFAARRGPAPGRLGLARHPLSSATLTTLVGNRAGGIQGNYVVSLQNQAQAPPGGMVVGFYLPGDADGSGRVDDADLQFVRDRVGATMQSENYDFNADVNRDGRINFVDFAYTRFNRGVSTTLSPVLSANLDPATDTGEPDRITDLPQVRFTGQASAGATISFSEQRGAVPDATTVVDANGNYELTVDVAPGMNVYQVTSTDRFGQTISGQLSPVFRPVQVS